MDVRRVGRVRRIAAAGIPAYSRVETTPEVSLTAYALPHGASVYAEVGTWTAGQTAHLEQPFRIDVPIDRLTPGPAEVGQR